MKRFNRLWALLLAFALMITYMPAMAFAEGEVTVTYDANGGYYAEWNEDTESYDKVEQMSETYGMGEQWLDPGTPEREGYVFAGWTESKDGGEFISFDDAYTLEGNVTFYAQWAQAWQVTFDANGGKFVDSNGAETTTRVINVSQEDNYLGSGTTYYDVEEDLSFTGKIFSYWTDENGKIVDFDEGVNITSDTKYYANWEDGYTLTLDGGDRVFEKNGESTVVQYYKKGGDFYVASGYAIGGETFYSEDGKVVMAWKTESGETLEKTFHKDYTINKDMTLYAIWGDEFQVQLDAGDGKFDSPSHDTSVVEGDYLSFFGTKEVSVNGKSAFVYNRIYKEDQLMPPEGKIFEGWYYNSKFDDPVLLETPITSELYKEKKAENEDGEEKLILHAKYTDEYNEVTLDTNGTGYLYDVGDENVTSLSLDCPAGKVLDLSEHIPDSDDYDETFAGWYLDKECTEKADVTEDKYFLPEENTTLYAKWKTEIDYDLDMELSGDRDGRFFLDGDYKITADVYNYDDIDLSEFVKDCYINVYDISSGETDIENLDPVLVLKNDSSTKYLAWSLAKNTITLYATPVKSALDSLSIEYDNICLQLVAELKTEDGDRVTGDSMLIYVSDKYYDYGLDWIFAFYDDDKAIDHKKEILLGKDDDDDGIPVFKEMYAKEFSSKSPYGEIDDVPFKVKKVESGDPSIIKISSIPGAYYIDPVALGTTTVTINYYDVNNNVQSETYEVTVASNHYYVWFDGYKEYDDYEDLAMYKAVPGGSVELKADGNRRDFYSAYKDGYTFRWSFSDEEAENYADLVWSEQDSQNATVTIDSDADPDAEFFDEGLKVKVEILDDQGVARASTEAKINVVSEWYEIVGLPDEADYRFMKPNDSITITPELRRYAKDTVDKEGGYEVASDKDMRIQFYAYTYDEDEDEDIEIEVINVTSEGNTLESGDVIRESFTIKRLNNHSCSIKLYVPKENNGSYDDEDYDDEDYDDEDEYYASADLDLSHVYDLSKIKTSKIYGFTDLVYTGKARKHDMDDLTIMVVNEDDEEYPIEGYEEAFTVTYSKNKDVGKAAAKITGNGVLYGTKTVYFNILPKSTSLSKVTAGAKSFTAKWKKQSAKMSKYRITGYEIQYSTSSKFTKSTTKSVKVKGYSKVSKKVTGLKAKKIYYVRIRTYRGSIYSAWSKVKKVKTK